MTIGRTRLLAVAAAVVATVAATVVSSTTASGDEGESSLSVHLSGYQEDPLVISTTGRGEFRANTDRSAQTIEYELSYADLEGSVLQAHIHVGGRAQSGGISVFLCTNLGNGPAGTQPCPAAPATITGTITPANVIGPAGQGISAGQFDELINALRAGKTYVNVHTSLWPGGEIRAQLDHEH
ncbi:MAG TPA: CHRD domain-containing protein [Micromonosporaceae bacterium]|nr:CHRD domain-containing protein [Micromonosporaceae bacterium]